MGNNFTHWCITEKDDIYVLDIRSKSSQQVFAPLEHILCEHPEVLELSMRAVRWLGFPL